MKKYIFEGKLQNRKFAAALVILSLITLNGCRIKESEQTNTEQQQLEDSALEQTEQAEEPQDEIPEAAEEDVEQTQEDLQMEPEEEILPEETELEPIVKEEPDNVQIAFGESAVVSDPYGGPDTINGVPIINKRHSVSADYAPGEDPEAKAALVRLIADMQSLGLNVSNAYSGYRSYWTQNDLYNGYVARSGQAEADTYSARPGYSEHQSGLAYDLKNYNGQLLTTPVEAQWLLDHAHEYGFIVRYQAGWEEITGYMAEPWHLRYVGDLAADIRAANVPLETYFGLANSQYQ